MQIVYASGRRDQRLMVKLTPRERDVLALLARGRSNGEIGAALSMAPSTAKNYIYRLAEMLGMTRIELAIWAHTHPAALRGEPVDSEIHRPGSTAD